MAENRIQPEAVNPTGPGGRILKEDVLRATAEAMAPASESPKAAPASAPPPIGDRQDELIPMSRLRRTVAERLVQIQQTAALLTTFNEVDMSAVMALRSEFGEAFLKKHNVKLGFMSFFVKAVVEALKHVPVVNAEVREANIVYHNYYDIGVAIGGGKGLVVPVLRNTERMSFAEIEIAIGEFAKRAKENRLKPDELQGGTFTISNGGIYGSLMSTPIINPPQSGILGMHAIQERPVARAGNVVIRPMMYLALTYDHRIVDGREAVTFLRHIKDFVENPARMLLEV
jgi:2-oxoglutarate dehydrogenase E2 component (dihydrolipoamide succinyltransferase)